MTHPDGVAHGPDGAPPPGSALSNSEQTTGTADSSGSSRSVGAAGHVGGGRRSALNGYRFLLVATGAGLCVAAACSLIIAKLLADVNSADGAVRRDPQILTWAVDHRTAALTTLFRAVTHLADPLVVILVAAVAAQLLFRARHRTLALLVVATTAGTAVTTTVMKAAVDRARPPQTLWLSFASGPAFPSGHSAQSVALYGSIAVAITCVAHRRALRAGAPLVAAALAVAVGSSRVYLGVHWPTDVLCGWAVAILWLTILLLSGWSLPRLRAGLLADRASRRGRADCPDRC